MMYRNLTKILLGCAMLTTGAQTFAQNLNLDKTLQTATTPLLRFDSDEEGSVPFTWEEIAMVPIQTALELTGSRLVRGYIRKLIFNKMKTYIPAEATALETAQNEFAPAKKLYKSKGGRFRRLVDNYDRAENGYWVQDYQTVVGTGIGADGKVTTTFTSVPAGKHFVGPDKVEAARLKPLVANEQAKLGNVLTDYEQTEQALSRAQSRFDIASDTYLDKSGAKYATSEGAALRAELAPLKITRVAVTAVEVYIVVNAVTQVAVILDGRHPGLFPSIPVAKATPHAIKKFIDPYSD